MSKSIVIYTDGSGSRFRRSTIAWAFVALHDDTTVESAGLKIGRFVKDNHEWCAMVEAYLYAKSHGFINSEIAVYTDCNDFLDCIFSIQDENYRFVSQEKWRNRINTFLKQNYDFLETDLFIEFLLTARIYKVKAHSFLVYNTRADYLAKNTLRIALNSGRSTFVMKPYETWMRSAGFQIPFIHNVRKGEECVVE